MRSMLLLAIALLAASGGAQAYPTQPIRFVVPFTPGTGMDIIARQVAPRLTDRLGQPVVVENRLGASGNVGADFVARSAPDGHTIMVGANTLVIAAQVYRQVPFDPLADFSPLTLAGVTTLVLAVNPGAGIDSVADLVAHARAQPGK